MDIVAAVNVRGFSAFAVGDGIGYWSLSSFAAESVEWHFGQCSKDRLDGCNGTGLKPLKVLQSDGCSHLEAFLDEIGILTQQAVFKNDLQIFKVLKQILPNI